MKKKIVIFWLVLLGIVACVVIAIWLILPMEWGGFRNWTFRVTVIDAETRKPVSTAIGRIVVGNDTSLAKFESAIRPDTTLYPANPSGIIFMTSHFLYYGKMSRTKITTFMIFRNRNLRVEAPGYQRFERPLKTIVTTPLEYKSLPCTTNVEVALTHAG